MAKAIVLLIGIAAFTGCAARATPSEPRLVSIPDAGARPVYRLEAIFDYRTAAATVVTIAQRDLRFGTFPVTFEFHSNRAAFERRLLGVGYDPGLARSTAQTMTAVGGHRRVLINEGNLDRMPWPARLALLAHELGHSLQYELGGGTRGTSDQWLREGFADWLSIRVLERLDAASMSDARATRRREFRAAGRSAPRLDDLVTFRQWVAAGERQGPAAYALAFLAVDFLLARHDVAPVVEYFGLFAASQDRMGNFRRAFGQDLESFQAEFEASLRR
ncbi:MAG TPA: hypothetical protein VD833_11540 [Vicinamibacterales bacterium]|nr:hypothetical protein [Vicinamibacterales bacterium]